MEVLNCFFCGREIHRYRSHITAHNFCSRECQNRWRSKQANPEGYLRNTNSPFERLNAELNKTKMTPEVRQRLRDAHLGKGEGKTYTKTFGRHTHRIVAEEMLGRPLRPGEVVHHMDGNKRNNSPNNLFVFPSQIEHAWWHKEHGYGF